MIKVDEGTKDGMKLKSTPSTSVQVMSLLKTEDKVLDNVCRLQTAMM